MRFRALCISAGITRRSLPQHAFLALSSSAGRIHRHSIASSATDIGSHFQLTSNTRLHQNSFFFLESVGAKISSQTHQLHFFSAVMNRYSTLSAPLLSHRGALPSRSERLARGLWPSHRVYVLLDLASFVSNESTHEKMLEL